VTIFRTAKVKNDKINKSHYETLPIVITRSLLSHHTYHNMGYLNLHLSLRAPPKRYEQEKWHAYY
jgi:hypothetical protein